MAGAEVFERHLALENQKKGFDLKFSSRGREFKSYVKNIERGFKLLGKNYFLEIQVRK